MPIKVATAVNTGNFSTSRALKCRNSGRSPLWPAPCHTLNKSDVRGGNVQPAFDEMNGLGGGVREPYAALSQWLGGLRVDDLKRKSVEAEALFRRTGITFA